MRCLLLYLPPLAVLLGCLFVGQTHLDPLAEPRFDGEAAWSLLEELVALGPRYDKETREAASQLILDDAADWGGSVRRDPFTFEGVEGWNVVAELPGTGPHQDERVAIVGHFDTVPGSPGALDDATAVALLAGLGRALAARPLDRTVVLLAVDLEERGLYGTRAFLEAEAEAGQLDRYRVGISTEMLGWAAGQPVMHSFPSGYRLPPGHRPPGGGLAPRWLVAETLAAGAAQGRPLAFGDSLLEPVYHVIVRHFITPFESDSGAFAARGIPALFLSDCSFSRFYPEYHQPADGLSQVDRGQLEQAGVALEALVVRLATRDALPRSDQGVREAETDYYTLRGRVIPGLGLLAALLLAVLPLLAVAWGGGGPVRWWTVGLAILTAVVGGAAPVAGFTVLFTSWLLAPLLLAQSRLLRIGGGILVAAPLLVVSGTIGAAALKFGRSVPPSEGGWALAGMVLVVVGLLVMTVVQPKAAS